MAALLNISRETGSVASPTEVYFGLSALLDGPSRSLVDGCSVDADGDVGIVCSFGINVDSVRKVSLSAAT